MLEKAELLDALQRFATANRDLHVTYSEVSVKPEQLSATGQAALILPRFKIMVRLSLTPSAVPMGRDNGLDIAGTIDNVRVTGVELHGHPVLHEVTKVINAVVAGAVSIGNWFIKPEPVELQPITLGDIDLAGIANVKTATPTKVVFPTLHWDGVVPIFDADRIAIMGRLATPGAPPIDTALHQTTPPDLWGTFRTKFQATWTQQFGALPLTGDAHAYLRTDFVSNLINATWNAANP